MNFETIIHVIKLKILKTTANHARTELALVYLIEASCLYILYIFVCVCVCIDREEGFGENVRIGGADANHESIGGDEDANQS